MSGLNAAIANNLMEPVNALTKVAKRMLIIS